MRDLISRLEKAESGSWELDVAIIAATYCGDGPMPRTVHGFTSSIDAIVALIGEKLPGAVWHVATDYGLPGRAKIGPAGRPSASVYNHDDAPHFVVEDGETPALALCIALLKALDQGGADV